MRAVFGRKISSLKELKELTESAAAKNQKGQSYVVSREVKLSDDQFITFASDFFKAQEFILPEDGGTSYNGDICCIRVRNEKTGESVLVNSEGYDYPRYTAVEPERSVD